MYECTVGEDVGFCMVGTLVLFSSVILTPSNIFVYSNEFYDDVSLGFFDTLNGC